MANPPPTPGKSMPLGLTIIGTEIAGFAAIGAIIDYTTGLMQSVPWATLILSPLGLVVAMYHLIQLTSSTRDPGSK